MRDGIAAAHDDRPDFAYRVRLATSHLVEALDSLNAYSHEDDAAPASPEVASTSEATRA